MWVGGVAMLVWSPVPSTLSPYFMNSRRSCCRQFNGLLAKYSASCMCRSPFRCASASLCGSMFRNVYCLRLSSATYLCMVSGFCAMLALSLLPFSMRVSMS